MNLDRVVREQQQQQQQQRMVTHPERDQGPEMRSQCKGVNRLWGLKQLSLFL